MHVFERAPGRTEISHPPFQSFGESLEVLTQYLFETDLTSSLWKETLTRCVQDRTLDQLEHQLELPLGFSARTYLASIKLAVADKRK